MVACVTEHMLAAVCELVTTFTQREIPLQLYSLFNEKPYHDAHEHTPVTNFFDPTPLIFFLLILDVGLSCSRHYLYDGIDDRRLDHMIFLAHPTRRSVFRWEKIKHAVDKGFADKNPQATGSVRGRFCIQSSSRHSKFLGS